MEQIVFEDADKSILVADYKLMELELSLDKPVYTQGIYLVKSILYRNFALDGTEVTRIVENIEKYMVKCVLEKTMPLKVSMADSFIYVLGVLLRRKLISRERYDGVLHMIRPFLPVEHLERSFFCGALTDFKHDMETCGKYCNVKDRFSMLLLNILYDNEKCQVSEICECIDDFELALHDSYFERDIIYGQMAVVGINYMKDNLHYPSYGIRNKIEGRAVISFVVRKDGMLCNIYNVKTGIPCFDNEALRVVRNMPYWTPRTVERQGGKCTLHIACKFLYVVKKK